MLPLPPRLLVVYGPLGPGQRLVNRPERRDLFLADVTGPDGYEYGPRGIGETWLEAKHSGKKFVRDIRAIVAGMSRGMREITFSTSTCLEC